MGGAAALSATANMSSIFDRYREQGFADEYIRGIEFALILAGLPPIEVRKAALLILEGAICGQLCFDLDVPGSDDPWYLVGWLIAGAVPIVDIVTDGRDFFASSGTCVTRLLTMNECDWVSYGANFGGLVFSIVPIGGQVANVAQAGVHIGKFAVKCQRNRNSSPTRKKDSLRRGCAGRGGCVGGQQIHEEFSFEDGVHWDIHG